MRSKEVMALTGLTRKTLRCWEDEGILSPSRSDSKYRDYGRDDLLRIFSAKVLQDAGCDLKHIAETLGDDHAAYERSIDTQIAELEHRKAQLDEQIAVLKHVKSAYNDQPELEPTYLTVLILKHPEYAWVLRAVYEDPATTAMAEKLTRDLTKADKELRNLTEQMKSIKIDDATGEPIDADDEEVLDEWFEALGSIADAAGYPRDFIIVLILVASCLHDGVSADSEETREAIAEAVELFDDGVDPYALLAEFERDYRTEVSRSARRIGGMDDEASMQIEEYLCAAISNYLGRRPRMDANGGGSMDK